MKYLLFSIVFLSFIIAEENTTYLKVEGMQCSYSCAGKVSNVVQKIDGVKDCSVDFSKGVATVVYDDQKLKSNDIISALQVNTSYVASEMCEKSKNSYISSGGCEQSKKKKNQKI
jgi:copper chaperone CopZ